MLYLCYGVFLLFMEFHFLDKMVDGTEGKRFAFMRRLHVRGIEWSLRACEQSVYFCEHEHLTSSCKILRAQASEHPSNFCEQFEQRPNFTSTFKLNETILYPSCELHHNRAKNREQL